MDAEDSPEPGGLDFHPRDILYAFHLAALHYAKGRSHKDSLHNRWDVALSIFDRAVKECDRGKALLDLSNKLEKAEAELAMLRKGGLPGPFGLG